MKRFYKTRKVNYYVLILALSVIIDIILFNTIINRYSNNLMYFTKVKLDEITRYNLNDVIKKYVNINSNNYIKPNIVNNSIVSVDVDNESANELLASIISDLEKKVFDLESGNINNYKNLELISGNKGIIILVPIGVAFNNTLLSNIGPKIPIKANFLENIYAYIDVEVSNYGINNSLIKLYVNINISQVIEMPYNDNTSNVEYKYLLSSKLINGEVPSFMGDIISRNGNIVNSSVK